MKKVAGSLKITLALYRAQAAFAMFASDLDATTRQQLTRGERLMELLKQPQYTPYKAEQQVVSMWTGTAGYLDEIPVEMVHSFESGLLDYVAHNSDVLSTIAETGQLSSETEDKLREAVEAYQHGFLASEGLLQDSEAEVETEQAKEQIVRGKRG